jgi:hypothetical protein
VFITAYFLAVWLWVPLLALFFAGSASRSRWYLVLPIVLCLLATIWEAMMPSQMNIRLDLMLIVPLIGFGEACAGIGIAAALYGRRKRGESVPASLAAAAALCLVVPVLLAFAWNQSSRQSEAQTREFDEGNRYRFEASFRDDEAERSAFGDLRGDGWTGYYVANADKYAWSHLVINKQGDFWLFTTELHEAHGRGATDPVDAKLFSGTESGFGAGTTLTLRDLGGGRVSLVRRGVNEKGEIGEVVFEKKASPRFPRAASSGDKVRFKGVFSTRYQSRYAKTGSAWYGQIWLWESNGRIWGVRSRELFRPGDVARDIGSARFTAECAARDCSEFTMNPGDSRDRFKWESPDRLTLDGGAEYGTIVYERGEIFPGFIFHLAPLATEEENREWLHALHMTTRWAPPI